MLIEQQDVGSAVVTGLEKRQALARCLNRRDVNTASRRWLSRGRAANADVSLLVLRGESWVVKDFSACAWWFRHTVGRLMVYRELRALAALNGLPGIPADAHRVDALALAYRFVPARPLGEMPRCALPSGFFPAFEALVTAMHRRGFVHLDLRNGGNVLVTPEMQPVLIDFQSSVRLRAWIPGSLLKRIDRSGVYKFWWRYSPSTLGEQRRQELEGINAWRHWWVFSGYLGLRRWFQPRA